MKKIVSILLILMLAVSVLAGVSVASAADLVVNSWDFNESWEGYATANYEGNNRQILKLADGSTSGDWQVFYEHPGFGKDHISVVNGTFQHNGETITVDEERGNVLLMDNLTYPGTYINIGYCKDGFMARNFTIEYDIMPLHKDSPTGWTSFISRWEESGLQHTGSINVISTLSMTTGTGNETVPLADGTTRASKPSDFAYWSRSATASGTGSSQMAYESGITKVSDFFFLTNGGGMRYKWMTVRVEAKDGYYSKYVKQTCDDTCETDCKVHRWFETGTHYYEDTTNKIYSGTIGFGQCIGIYLYDNIKFKSNDGNAVTVENMTKTPDGKDAGKARLMSSTAANGSIIELISETESGYVFDKWYKDADKTNTVTPVEFVLQEHVLNESFGLYDWEEVIGATDGIKTWDDLISKTVFVKDGELVDESTPGAEEIPWRDYYSTTEKTKYRLITRVKTGPSGDGYKFYSTSALKKYNVTLYSNDETMGEVTIQGLNTTTSKFTLEDVGTMVATPLAGYEFAGWYKEVKGQNPNDEGGVKDETFAVRVSTDASVEFALESPNDVTYKAVFVPQSAGVATLNITLNSTTDTVKPEDMGSVVTSYGEGISYREGETISMIAEAKDGYAFVGWKDNDGYVSTEPYYDYTLGVGENSLTAVFEIETFRIFVIDGIGSPVVERYAKANSRITMYPATAPSGYTFAGWLVTGISPSDWHQDENGKLELNVTSRSIRVQARFAKNTHRVRIRINDSDFGAALGAGTKAVGDTVTITPMPQAGYSISRYVVRGVDATINEDGTLSFVMPDEDVIIRVEFTKIDKIDVGAEITMYAIFALVGLGIVASILFAGNKNKRQNG